MDASQSNQLLRLKIASEIVLGNQASVAFSRAFYLEDLLIERILKEFHELSQQCQVLLDQIKQFTEEALDSDSSHLTPLSESSVRCQCSEMLESLGTVHQPTLETFQQKLIQAKARRQAKSCLLEKLSTRNNNITTKFNLMTLDELVHEVHIPEFSCFINDSDFGDLEKFVEEWDQYRSGAKEEFAMHDKKVNGFRQDVEKAKRMREYTCDRILAQITQQKQPLLNGGSETLKRKGVFHKFSTLLRRHTHHQHSTTSASTLSLNSPQLRKQQREQSPSPSPSSRLTVAESPDSHQQTF